MIQSFQTWLFQALLFAINTWRLYVALLRPPALCDVLHFNKFSRSLVLICKILHPTMFRGAKFGNFRYHVIGSWPETSFGRHHPASGLLPLCPSLLPGLVLVTCRDPLAISVYSSAVSLACAQDNQVHETLGLGVAHAVPRHCGPSRRVSRLRNHGESCGYHAGFCKWGLGFSP